MKSFEKEITRRILWLAIFGMLSGLTIVIVLIIKNGFGIDCRLSTEVLAGMFIGIAFVSLSRIFKYRKALSSSERLESLQIEETDERNRIISFKTSRLCLYISLPSLGLAAIISSFFNRAVFLTIGIILIVFIALYGTLRLYYFKKI